MLLKPKSFITATAFTCAIVLAGVWLFSDENNADILVVTPLPAVEQPSTLEQDIYPLPSQDINAMVNTSAHNRDQQNDVNAEQIPPIPVRLPSSLLGATLPLSLDVSDVGDLIINKKIQHLFDFYLSAMGEESLDVIVARIKQALTSQLVEPALTQGITILTGYLQYLNEVTAIKQQFEQSIDPETAGEYALESVIQVREIVLDARSTYLELDVIAAFFGQADEYETYMLSVASINQNSELSTAEKQAAKAELDTTAPEWLLEQQRNANQLNDYREQYKALQSQGASETELQDFTQESFEPEVADRLARLGEERQQWQVKLKNYREELAVITASTTYNESDSQQQQQEIAQLREVYFTSQEIKRVSALDSINSRNSTTTAL